MWPNPQEIDDLVTFTDEIHNGKLPFLCRERQSKDDNTLRIKVTPYNRAQDQISTPSDLSIFNYS